MAERGFRDGHTRRQSFRQNLAQTELPIEYLDALEQKRRQLDESIHKYVAAKERDYKQYEKEVKQQYSLSRDRGKEGGKGRRTSSESTQEPAGSLRLSGKQQSVVEALSAAGLKRETIGQPVAVAVVDDDGPPTIEAKAVAGLTDRRASIDRDREFVGVFTPTYISALEGKSPPKGSKTPGRTCSDPAGSSSPPAEQSGDTHVLQRANSDGLADGKHKRPAKLQLLQRNSSSGSSVDGKLASAMRSPTHSSQPTRKRVSIAVGDSIVAPSDNVPASMTNNNNTPSHSRTRSSSIPERESPTTQAMQSPEEVQRSSMETTLSSQPVRIPPNNTPGTDEGSELALANTSPLVRPAAAVETEAVPPILPTAPLPIRSSPAIDPDGDLFDLEDEQDIMATSSFDAEDEITGRVNVSASRDDQDEVYDSNAGLMPQPESTDSHDNHIEFGPGSAVASQQPTNPGFRRPSVTSDPVYIGSDYAKAEENAVVNDVYGSSHARQGKGSFTSGSLGESFMARNAEQLMRSRITQGSAHVRS